MELFKQMNTYGHEEILFCSDKKTNLKAIIAVHDTTLGPALGGTRMFPYESEESAIIDVLRLSEAMTYKNAAAGLNFGGGKAVIIGDSYSDKNPELLLSYGQFVDSLCGKYIAAGDVGITSDDLVQIRLGTRHVRSLPMSSGGSGDSSILTALGVLRGIMACCKQTFGSDSLEGKIVAVQGLGKCGYNLVKMLREEGIELIVSDTDSALTDKVVKELGVTGVAPDKIYGVACDIFSPCAMGAVLNERTIPRLKCRIIAGSANNQLADEKRDSLNLQNHGIIYVPDFIVNAGGVINISFEAENYDAVAAQKKTLEIYDTVCHVIAKAKSEGIPTIIAARRIAEDRINRRRRKSMC